MQLEKFGKRCSRETTQLHLRRAYNESTISMWCSSAYSPSAVISFLPSLNNRSKYVFRQSIKPAMTSVVKYVTVREDLKTRCSYPPLFHQSFDTARPHVPETSQNFAVPLGTPGLAAQPRAHGHPGASPRLSPSRQLGVGDPPGQCLG